MLIEIQQSKAIIKKPQIGTFNSYCIDGFPDGIGYQFHRINFKCCHYINLRLFEIEMSITEWYYGIVAFASDSIRLKLSQ